MFTWKVYNKYGVWQGDSIDGPLNEVLAYLISRLGALTISINTEYDGFSLDRPGEDRLILVCR